MCIFNLIKQLKCYLYCTYNIGSHKASVQASVFRFRFLMKKPEAAVSRKNLLM